MTDRAEPSELKRVIEQCDACGRFRYPNDLIAYDCHGCGEWAEKQIIALRAEIADLKAELAKYTEPLTHEQAVHIHFRFDCKAHVDTILHHDAAIRRVRRGG